MSTFIIIPIADLTYSILNLSTSRKLGDVRKNADGTKVLLEILYPLHDNVLKYEQFNEMEIKRELRKPEWRTEDVDINNVKPLDMLKFWK
jgi:hypothetical protein